MRIIGSVMVFSLLFSACGTLSHLLYFCLPSKGRSVTTLGTRWHDFLFFSAYRVLFPFLNILAICYILVIAFLFFRDTDLRKGALCPFCVPIHKKKKKKVNVY